jgi:hypothetical protein
MAKRRLLVSVAAIAILGAGTTTIGGAIGMPLKSGGSREKHSHARVSKRDRRHHSKERNQTRPTTTTSPSTTTTTTTSSPTPTGSSYPIHTNITATVFWVGEPVGDGSTENNAISAYDDDWEKDYGGYDNYAYFRTSPFFPSFTPHENPFYLDFPYDDINNKQAHADRTTVVPWASQFAQQLAGPAPFSLMKNHWVRLWRTDSAGTHTCYGQIEDAGPYTYDDENYVFGSNDARPASRQADNAGLDVSPGLRDCLHFDSLNGDDDKVDWQFVNATSVPAGPWTIVITTSQVNQH